MSLVTHLECSLTGERYAAGEVHNHSRAGKPLLVRYDLEAAARTLTAQSIGGRAPGMWKWRECCRMRVSRSASVKAKRR